MPRQLNQIDTSIEIVTPENISFQYEVAGPFRRLPAFIIDFAVRLMIIALAVIAISFLVGFVGTIVTYLIAYFVLEWFYGAVLETYWNGQTIGKRLTRIRVLTVDGQPINGLQAMLRNLMRLADMMPLIPLSVLGDETPGVFVSCFVGLSFSLMSKRYQRLGDLVCGTIVVVEERRILLAADYAKDKTIVACAAALPANLQLSRRASKALATYAERRKYLSPSRRIEIASYFVEPIIQRFGLPTDADYDLIMRAMYYRTYVSQLQTEDDLGDYASKLESSFAPTAPFVSTDNQDEPNVGGQNVSINSDARQHRRRNNIENAATQTYGNFNEDCSNHCETTYPVAGIGSPVFEIRRQATPSIASGRSSSICFFVSIRVCGPRASRCESATTEHDSVSSPIGWPISQSTVSNAWIRFSSMVKNASARRSSDDLS